jgi:predicted aspartyl protease
MLKVCVTCVIAVVVAGPNPTVRLPFHWTPGQIEVNVRANGLPATFLLDTGAEYSVVSSRLADRLGLALEKRGSREFADDVGFAMNDVVLLHQRVMVSPFDGYYARGRAIDGLLGYDFFARFVVEIDFKGGTLVIWEPARFAPPKGTVSVPIEFAGRLPVMSSVLTLDGGRALQARLMVDTGASQAVLLRYPFAKAHDLLDLRGEQSTAPSLASGTRTLTAVPVQQIAFATWTFARPNVRAFAEPIGSAAATDSDGLIGNDLLARFTLFVDYPHKRLVLRPTAPR